MRHRDLQQGRRRDVRHQHLPPADDSCAVQPGAEEDSLRVRRHRVDRGPVLLHRGRSPCQWPRVPPLGPQGCVPGLHDLSRRRPALPDPKDRGAGLVTDTPESPVQVVREGRIGLVPARFGEGMVGGAEIVLHQMAKRLQDRGWDVKILTTTAMNHHTWESELPAGESKSDDGLLVRRFPAVFHQTEERQKLEGAIMAGHPVSIADQQRWINSGMRSPELFHYLLDHGDDYRALIFTPYPSWIAFACSQLLPERSVLWTCLHDEPYAYLELFQPMFTGVAGLLLQTEPEHELAHRVAELGPHALVGCGVEIPQSYDA